MAEKYEVTVKSQYVGSSMEEWCAVLHVGTSALDLRAYSGNPRHARSLAECDAHDLRAALATIVPEEEKPDGD